MHHLNVFVALVNNIHFIGIMNDLASDIDDPMCVEEREVSVKPKSERVIHLYGKKKLQKHVVIMVMHTLEHTQINTLLPELLDRHVVVL